MSLEGIEKTGGVLGGAVCGLRSGCHTGSTDWAPGTTEFSVVKTCTLEPIGPVLKGSKTSAVTPGGVPISNFSHEAADLKESTEPGLTSS